MDTHASTAGERWETPSVAAPALILIVLALIVLAVILVRRAAARSRTSKACPDCRSRVPVDARVCGSCGYRFEDVRPPDWPGAGSG